MEAKKKYSFRKTLNKSFIHYSTNKKRKATIFLISFLGCTLLFFSCNNDEDYYSLNDIWISMGFIDQETDGNRFTVLLDNGDTLVPVSNSVPYFETTDSQRVMVNFTILDEVGQSTKQFYVKINNLYDILYKDIIELTTSNSDSLGNDPVQIDKIWMNHNLLNIEFCFLGSNNIHCVNMIRQSGKIQSLSQPIKLEFRHNNQSDKQIYRLRSVVTFNLKNLKVTGQDSVRFEVKSTDYEGNKHTFNSTYYY